MGRRGPKPVDMGTLNVWEFEWYKAFHLLRDGVQLPPSVTPPPLFNRERLRTRLRQLQRMTAKQFWAELRSQAGKNWRPPTRVDWLWAEWEKDREIAQLRWYLEPREIPMRAERSKVWNALIRARTFRAVRGACERWRRLPDVRVKGFACFADHVQTNAKQFLAMKRNKRFPRSAYAADSRLEYLARGMAGVLVGVSPMTAIERLRNMEHGRGGSLRGKTSKRCTCWRCEIENWNEALEIIRKEYEL